MEQALQFIQHNRDWFYVVTVLWTFFEGETFVLIAAMGCANGQLDPIKLGACAWVGSCLGDQCWFMIGRRCGPLVLRRWPRLKLGVDMVHRRLRKWDTLFILTFRFMYGIRNVSAIALGLSDVTTTRFLLLNIVAAGLWSVVYVGAGLLFGKTLGLVVGHWAERIEIGIAALFLIGCGVAALIARGRALRARLARDELTPIRPQI